MTSTLPAPHLREDLLTPRFYTTEIDKAAKTDLALQQVEFEAMLQEMETDYNREHFDRKAPLDRLRVLNAIEKEAYESYLNYPLATIHDHRTNILYKNMSKGWCMLNGRSMASPHPTRHLTKEEFINKIKTDSEFSETWGLKIDERELSL